jgi:hypothetical protein
VAAREAALAEAAALRRRVDELTVQVGQLAGTLTALSAQLTRRDDAVAPAARSAGGDEVEQPRREDVGHPVG